MLVEKRFEKVSGESFFLHRNKIAMQKAIYAFL